MPYLRGDYYRGDPFLGGLISGAAKLLGGPVLKVAGRALGIGRKVVGAAKGFAQRHPVTANVAATAATGYALGKVMKGGGGASFGRSRRMNITNVKALRRAGRRVRGFLKLARRFGAMPISPKGKKLFKQRRRK